LPKEEEDMLHYRNFMYGYFRKISGIYNKYIRGHHEEPRFLIITSFTLTFIFTRLFVYNIHYHFLPIQTYPFFIHDLHVHHLVFGIFFLLIAGFIRIPQFGRTLFRFSSVLYGVGAALTLDEFALWLHLEPNRYFGSEGRINIDAVVIFLLIALSSLWHGVFWRKLFQYTIGQFFPKK
jgi:hypothetical protein